LPDEEFPLESARLLASPPNQPGGFSVAETQVTNNLRFAGQSHYGVWNRLFASFLRSPGRALDEEANVSL
jgi:hypothetical protein